MVIYAAKRRLKSKSKGFVLIGLCFVGEIGLVKRSVGGGGGLQFPQDNVFSLSYCVGQNPSPAQQHLRWITLCSNCAWSLAFWFNLSPPPSLNIYWNQLAIWLREVRAQLNCWQRLRRSQRVSEPIRWTYKSPPHPPPPSLQLGWFRDHGAVLNPRPFQQRSHQPEIDEAGRRLKAAHCGKANMNPHLT